MIAVDTSETSVCNEAPWGSRRSELGCGLHGPWQEATQASIIRQRGGRLSSLSTEIAEGREDSEAIFLGDEHGHGACAGGSRYAGVDGVRVRRCHGSGLVANSSTL